MIEADDRDRTIPGWLRAVLRSVPSNPGIGAGAGSQDPTRMTMAEFGALLAGAKPHEASAVRYCYLGCDSEYEQLYLALVEEGHVQTRIHRRDYTYVNSTELLRHLCALVIREQRLPASRRTDSMRARWMYCDFDAFQRKFARAHRRLAGAIDNWASSGVTTICDQWYGRQ